MTVNKTTHTCTHIRLTHRAEIVDAPNPAFDQLCWVVDIYRSERANFLLLPLRSMPADTASGLRGLHVCVCVCDRESKGQTGTSLRNSPKNKDTVAGAEDRLLRDPTSHQAPDA